MTNPYTDMLRKIIDEVETEINKRYENAIKTGDNTEFNMMVFSILNAKDELQKELKKEM